MVCYHFALVESVSKPTNVEVWVVCMGNVYYFLCLLFLVYLDLTRR